MTRAEFERLVVEAIMLIPQRFRREMQNLALVVEEEPNAELLAKMEIEPPDSLYGLYQGIPLPERTWEHGNALPDCITLFQRPIEEDHEAEDEIRAAIGETLIHEVGHDPARRATVDWWVWGVPAVVTLHVVGLVLLSARPGPLALWMWYVGPIVLAAVTALLLVGSLRSARRWRHGVRSWFRLLFLRSIRSFAPGTLPGSTAIAGMPANCRTSHLFRIVPKIFRIKTFDRGHSVVSRQIASTGERSCL